MKVLLLNVFFVLIASVANAQSAWRTIDDFIQSERPDGYVYQGAISTLASGNYAVHVSGSCKPRENETITGVSTDVWIMPAKISNGKILVNLGTLDIIGMPSYALQGSDSNAGININFNFTNFHYPVIQMNRSLCWYELCENGYCNSNRMDKLIDVIGVNMEIADLKPDLKVDEVQISGDAIYPDGSGGYYFKADYKAPDPKLPFTLNAKVKISGNLTWDDVLGTSYLTLGTLGIKTHSPLSSEYLFHTSVIDLFRNGAIWSNDTQIDIYEKEIPDVFELKTEVNYYRGIDESNYDNNIKIVPLRLPSNDKPLLKVDSVQLAQVVYNPVIIPFIKGVSVDREPGYSALKIEKSDYLNAVEGKSASFRPTITFNLKGKPVPVGKFRVDIKDGNAVLLKSREIDFNEVSSGELQLEADDLFAPSYAIKDSFVPKEKGKKVLTAEISIISQNTPVETIKKDFTLNVVRTQVPSIGLYRISPTINEFDEPANIFVRAQLDLGKFLSEIFPVPDNSITISDHGGITATATIGMTVNDAMEKDVLKLDANARINGLNRAVGVASKSYMTKSGSGVLKDSGFWFNSARKGVIVLETDMNAMAHELAHSFNVNHEVYRGSVNDRIFDGYTANPNGFLSKISKFTGKFSIMDDKMVPLETALMNYAWIDRRSYGKMFSYLMQPDIDPETIIVNGIITRSGVVRAANVFDNSNGVITESVSDGDFKVVAVASDGAALSSVSMKLDFTIEHLVSAQSGGVDSEIVDQIPFAMELPSDEKIERIQFFKNGNKVSEQYVVGMIIPSLISRIPSVGYRAIGCKNKKDLAVQIDRSKQILMNLANKAQKEINNRQFMAAKGTIEALVVSVKLLTSSSYVPKDNFELSQSSVVSELKAILKSLSYDIKCRKYDGKKFFGHLKAGSKNRSFK